MFKYDMGQSSSLRATAEMAKEFEYKRKCTGVLTRLIGLDRISKQWRQKRFASGNHVPFNIQRSNENGHQPDFRPGFEDLEPCKDTSRRLSSRWSGNSMLTNHEIELIQKKFDSCALNGPHIFLKHLSDVDPTSYRGSHSGDLKSSNSGICEEDSKLCDPEVSRQDDLLLELQNLHRAINLGKKSIRDSSTLGSPSFFLNEPYSKPISEEAKRIAKEIASTMRHDFEDILDERHCYSQGDSSYFASGSDSEDRTLGETLSSKSSEELHKEPLERCRRLSVHSSPISVLEVSTPEETSANSESFERVGAQLNKLRTLLELLKMETGTRPEAEVNHLLPNEVPIEEEENFIQGTEGWESCYARDALLASGVEDTSFDIYSTMWISQDSLLDFQVFDNLENLYIKNGRMSERKLLFNRVNEVLYEMFEEHVDFFPWVKPKLVSEIISYKEGKEWVQIALDKLMNKDREHPFKFLDRGSQCADAKGYIDAVVIDIEFLLLDELISEILFGL